MVLSVSSVGRVWSLDFGPDCYFDCKRSRPNVDKVFPRVSSASLELVVSQRKDFLSHHLVRVSINSQPARDYGDAWWSTSKFSLERVGQKRVSGYQPVGYRSSLGGSWFQQGCSRPTRCRQSHFSFFSQQFWDVLNGWRPDSDWARAKQGEISSSSNNSRLRDTNPPYCVEKKFALLQHESRMFPTTFTEICLINWSQYYCVCTVK